MFDFDYELSKMPGEPGIYIMKDKNGRIIYVGKAISLKNRVRQYFQKGSSHSPKTRAMVLSVSSFEYIVTDNEIEALILECNLIKKHRPKYNIVLRDDKSYPYIKVSLNEEFPRVTFTRTLENDGSRYFGPYPSAKTVRETIDFLGKIFPTRTCAAKLLKKNENARPCLSYHIGRCLAPCTGTIDKYEYMNIVNNIISFLEGRQHRVVGSLKENMLKAASVLDFEKAAEIRDIISQLAKILEKQKVVTPRNIDCDAVVTVNKNNICCIQVYNIRDGRIAGRDNSLIEEIEENDGTDGTRGTSGIEELLSSFITMHYEPVAYIPPEIISCIHPDGEKTICEWLSAKRKGKVTITVPKIGYKHELLEMLNKNALMEIKRYEQEEGQRKKDREDALKKIALMLNLDRTPEYIEAFDISNTGSDDIVASMICFLNGEPYKDRYRRYKIKSMTVQNDLGSMKEAVERRFRRNKQENNLSIPDLLLIDGGRLQVSSVLSVLEELDLNIPVAGMVKDSDHRTRGLIFEGKEYDIKQNSSIYRLIVCIQDEAHRFAQNYSKKLRSKRQVHSVLDDIKGIGKTKRTQLLREFGSTKKIAEAPLDIVAKVIGRKAALEVLNRLNIQNKTDPD